MDSRVPLFVLMGLGFWHTSCDLFTTREPENPVQPSSTYLPPTEPAIVFSNMVNSFREVNSLNYVKSFSDSSTSGRNFVFEPTSQAQGQYGVFFSWSRQSEQQYFDKIKSELQTSSVPSLVLNFLSQSVGADSAQFEATYQLAVPHTRASVSQSAVGRAQFYLKKDSFQNWVILRWVDLANQPSDFTWSTMKGEFGQ